MHTQRGHLKSAVIACPSSCSLLCLAPGLSLCSHWLRLPGPSMLSRTTCSAGSTFFRLPLTPLDEAAFLLRTSTSNRVPAFSFRQYKFMAAKLGLATLLCWAWRPGKSLEYFLFLVELHGHHSSPGNHVWYAGVPVIWRKRTSPRHPPPLCAWHCASSGPPT